MSSNFWGQNKQSIDLDKAKQSFIKDFSYIYSLGFVTSHRIHNTGIGKTLEDLLNIEENNLSLPDYKGCIELKSQRDLTSSMLSIFTKSPSHPKQANTFIRKKYGCLDPTSGKKSIHTTIKSSNFNSFKNKWGFKLEFDDIDEKLYLKIKNLESGQIEQFKPYWDYTDLKKKITKKCLIIAYVTAETRKIEDKEQFHFQKVTLLSGLTFEKFITLLKQDIIQFDIRIGVYGSGDKKGQTHDHGSGFRTKKANISDVFEIEEVSFDDVEVNNSDEKVVKKPRIVQKKITDFNLLEDS